MKNWHHHKLHVSLYGSITATAIAVYGLFWFLNHSFLTISSLPSGAVVTVDNAPLWVSPFGVAKVTVSPGSHSVRVEADGYISYTENVSFGRAQSKKIGVELKELPSPFALGVNAQFLSKDNEFNAINYLDSKEKILYKAKLGLDAIGQVEIKSKRRLTDPRITDVTEIIWSPDKQLALFRKKDNTINIFDFNKYDFIHQTETPWGKDIGSIAWAPDNSKIAYYYTPENGERSLIFANISNTEITRVANLAEMNIVNPVLRWSPDSEWLIVVPRNSPDYQNDKVYSFNAYSRSFEQLTEGGNQLDATFSPDSNKIIYATYSAVGNTPTRSVLSVMDKDGKNQRSLDIRAELKKIVWLKDSKNIIVANRNEDRDSESLFSFNIETQSKNGFAINSLGGDAINSMAVSDDGNILVYEAGEGIYALKIE